MDTAQAKQQIVERIKQASNILVTVSNNPSVDQLASCIGLTLLLNRMDKHATAVFSGEIPSTIEFLQPEKTIETNTDSLQDFIISLDKNKADKLRYKVEDDVVRIFITPYRTSLSEKDLMFSQGDFNVEAVIALGVKDRAQLDKVITAHGRILHDATVISLNAGNDKAAELGQINWQEPTASSLSEMLVSISEAFGTGLIDNQIATAFLTGIVAETKRFSNERTSPKVMTMSAQLMAAGANQQLIVSKLEPPPPPPPPPKKPPEAGKPVAKKPPSPSPPPPPPTGVLNVAHEAKEKDSPEVEIKAGEIHIDEQGNIISSGSTAEPPPSSLPPVPKLEPLKPLVLEPPKIIKSSRDSLHEPQIVAPGLPSVTDEGNRAPIPGPHTLLDPTNHRPAISSPFTADTQPPWYDPSSSVPTDPLSAEPRPDDVLMGREKEIKPLDSARSAVDDAYSNTPFDPAAQPVIGLNTQPLSQSLHQAPANPPPPVPPPMMPTPKQ
ncbi:hypothetical protein HYS84_02830 [Candidatus Saccharibacteria bacterium]|nr:hypothetical protein [Candidatus Saccharibacteria bacterium]